MVRYSLPTSGQQQLLLLQQHFAMMEYHLQQQQQQLSPVSPPSQKEIEHNLRSRQINCVYFADGKQPTLFGVNTESAALCTSSSNLPTLRNPVSSRGAASSFSPTTVVVPSANSATSSSSSSSAPAPTTTTHTSFMISDILDSPNTRSTRTTSASSGAAADEGSGSYADGYCDDPSNGRDSPRSTISDDADSKERENREDSLGASDSDVERSSQSGKC